MTSPEQNGTASPILPETHSEADPSFLGRLRGKAAAWMISDVMKDIGPHRTSLHTDVVREKETIDPLTGETDINFVSRPFVIPRSKHEHFGLVESKGHQAEIDPGYYSFQDIAKGISGSSPKRYDTAVKATKEVRGHFVTAATAKPGRLRRGADRLASSEHKRSSQLHNLYTELNHKIYDTVMGVPNTIPDDGYDRPEDKPAPRDWSDELNLHNIQQLKAFLRHEYITNPYDGNNDSIETRTKRADDILQAGAINLLSPYALAAYLGVEAEALRRQREGGPAVVPPAVIEKIRYFMHFADSGDNNGTPANELSRDLSLFGHNERGTNAPMQRVLDAKQAIEDEKVRKRQEREQRRQDLLWATALRYVSGEYRSNGEAGKAYSKVSAESVAVALVRNLNLDYEVARQEMGGRLNKNHYFSRQDMRDPFIARAIEVYSDDAKEMYKRLIETGVVSAPDENAPGSHPVVMDHDQIQSILEEFLKDHPDAAGSGESTRGRHASRGSSEGSDKPDSSTDPRYSYYFEELTLKRIDDMIGREISERARQMCLTRGINRLPDDEFTELARSVRNEVIDGLGDEDDMPEEVREQMKRALRDLRK